MNAHFRATSAVVLLAGATFAAQPQQPPTLPPALAETLRWFPAEVDALVVASNFKFADAGADWSDAQEQQAWLAQDPMPRIFRAYASGRSYRQTDGGSNVPSAEARELRERVYVERIDQFWATLAQRQVEFAVMAAREVFPASAFGSCGYAACHVIRFAGPLGDDAAALAKKLTAGADKITRLGDRQLAQFNWTFPKEVAIDTRPWEGLFILIPQAGDRELFVATQRRLLEQVLARRATPKAERAAFPPQLPEWKSLDVSASIWGVLAKPLGDNPPAATARDVIAFEYHTGDDARFVLRAPGDMLPDDPNTIDPYAKNQPPTPALFVLGLSKMKVPYRLDRPPGEPARVTLPFAGDRRTVAQRAVAMTFLTGALFGHCIDQR